MSRIDEQVENLLRRDASVELQKSHEVPDLHQSLTSVRQNSLRAASQARLRPILVPLAAAAAAAVIVATPILLIQHNRPAHQAVPLGRHSAAPAPTPALSSSCAYGGVQARVGDHVPLSLLSCTGAAIGAYPGSNKLPAITVKVGDTVQISGAMLYEGSRLSLTPSTTASLTQTAAQQWHLLARQPGRITVEVTSPGLCRSSQQQCGLLTVAVTS